jgi:ribosome-associated protein
VANVGWVVGFIDIYEFIMIRITDTIILDDAEIKLEFIRASGPGGQNVNKVSSAVQLRFKAAQSPSLSATVSQRLKSIAGRRMTSDGEVIIKANRFRTQEQNRQDAVNRLVALIRKAAAKPRKRRPTRPTAASRERRLTTKRRRGEIKSRRRTVHSDREDA